MRATGIVRRMDELGRVVIPKELRRTMRIREGEELEVFTTDDNALVLKKFSAMEELADFRHDYASSVYGATGYTVIITDNDKVVAASGDIKGVRIGDAVGEKLAQIYDGRRRVELPAEEDIFSGKAEYRSAVVAPIISGGDVMGGVILLSRKPSGELAAKTADTAAAFFASRV